MQQSQLWPACSSSPNNGCSGRLLSETLVLKHSESDSFTKGDGRPISTSSMVYTMRQQLRNVVAMRIARLELEDVAKITIRQSGKMRNNIITFSELFGGTYSSFISVIPPGRYTPSDLVQHLRLKNAYGFTPSNPVDRVVPRNTYLNSGIATADNSDHTRFFIISNNNDAAKTTMHLSQVIFKTIGIAAKTSGPDTITYLTDKPHGMLPGAMIDLRNLGLAVFSATGDAISRYAVVVGVPSVNQFTVQGTTSTSASSFSEPIETIQYSRVGNFFADLGFNDLSGTTLGVHSVAPIASGSIQVNHPVIGLNLAVAAYRIALNDYTGLSVSGPYDVDSAGCTPSSTTASTATTVTAGQSFQGRTMSIVTTSGLNNFFSLVPNQDLDPMNTGVEEFVTNAADVMYADVRINDSSLDCVVDNSGYFASCVTTLDEFYNSEHTVGNWVTMASNNVRRITVNILDGEKRIRTNFTRGYLVEIEVQRIC